MAISFIVDKTGYLYQSVMDLRRRMVSLHNLNHVLSTGDVHILKSELGRGCPFPVPDIHGLLFPMHIIPFPDSPTVRVVCKPKKTNCSLPPQHLLGSPFPNFLHILDLLWSQFFFLHMSISNQCGVASSRLTSFIPSTRLRSSP